jgi:FtsZ-binding cell division protein ZapB
LYLKLENTKESLDILATENQELKDTLIEYMSTTNELKEKQSSLFKESCRNQIGLMEAINNAEAAKEYERKFSEL